MNIRRNGSGVWPYVIVGSAVGGTVACLFMTESGRKFRRSLSHPDELGKNLDNARDFVERKARGVSDQVHRVLDQTKRSIAEGERAYREANQTFQMKARQIESKNDAIATNVHEKVDRLSRTAVVVEHSVLDPLIEIGALYSGIQKGIRAILGKSGGRPLRSSTEEGPFSYNRDQRIR